MLHTAAQHQHPSCLLLLLLLLLTGWQLLPSLLGLTSLLLRLLHREAEMHPHRGLTSLL
jgi:hypothetical protein